MMRCGSDTDRPGWCDSLMPILYLLHCGQDWLCLKTRTERRFLHENINKRTSQATCCGYGCCVCLWKRHPWGAVTLFSNHFLKGSRRNKFLCFDRYPFI